MVVEIKSKTDRFKKIEEKIEMYLAQAAKVGIIIDPDQQTVTIYQAGQEAQNPRHLCEGCSATGTSTSRQVIQCTYKEVRILVDVLRLQAEAKHNSISNNGILG